MTPNPPSFSQTVSQSWSVFNSGSRLWFLCFWGVVWTDVIDMKHILSKHVQQIHKSDYFRPSCMKWKRNTRGRKIICVIISALLLGLIKCSFSYIYIYIYIYNHQSEINWEAFKNLCYKQIKRHWCRKPEAVTLTVSMVLQAEIVEYYYIIHFRVCAAFWERNSSNFQCLTSISHNCFQHFKFLKWSNLNVIFNEMTKIYCDVKKYIKPACILHNI